MRTLIFLLGCTAAFHAQAETSANVTLITDYLFRGISQTGDNPALQGGVDWNGNSGFYTGAWLSNTDFNPPGAEHSGVEVDLYGGYQRTLEAFAFSVGVIHYRYPSLDAHLDEVVLGFSYRALQAQYFHDWDHDTHYLSAGYDWSLERDITLGVAGGALEADQGEDYVHYQVSVSKPFRGLDFTLTLSDTDRSEDDATVLLGISTEFSF